MASIKEIKKEVDEIAPKLKELFRKDSLTDTEERQRFFYIEKLYKLLTDYAMKLNWNWGIKEVDYVDNPRLWEAAKSSLNIFLDNNDATYFNLFSSIYQQKKPDIKGGYFDLINHDNNIGLLRATHKFIQEIGLRHNVDEKRIEEEIKKRKRPNYGMVKKFAEEIGCDENELKELEEIYSFRYAKKMDSNANDDEETSQTYMEAEASLQKNKEQDKSGYDSFGMWDKILAITREEAAKKGAKAAEYMRGYWTIQFIEERIGKKQATIWEIYIILLFFLTYEHLYAKHGELMDLMANQFNLKRRAWHNHYVETFNDICRYIRKMHILKEDSYE